jgi:hypothetical protein
MQGCNLKQLAYVYGVMVLLIFGYSQIVANMDMEIPYGKKDPLNLVMFEIQGESISGWPITHLLFYVYIGYFFPCCDLPALLVGVGWELFESILGWCMDGSELQQKYTLNEPTKYGYCGNWWSGCPSDIVFNTIGFYIGKFMYMSTHPENKKVGFLCCS